MTPESLQKITSAQTAKVFPEGFYQNVLLDISPAHLWIQGPEGDLLYSNKFKDKCSGCSEDTQGTKKCFKVCRARETRCECCPYERISKNMRAEFCRCKWNGSESHVYHFPYPDAGGQLMVMKMEIEISDTEMNRTRFQGKGVFKDDNEFMCICASCKSVRDKNGNWLKIEKYVQDATGVIFSHGICEHCARELYPTLFNKRKAS